ncbi:MAG: hypothetical protein DAHOPDDO_00566 [Ignavibacteriaceae bacterium]|jgi:hypothetical protein|nr:hypothetical protein [Ignavibacteriaceae bacterium]MBV6419350.1 hypothetical protein [Ignavibacteriaceae bacterium]
MPINRLITEFCQKVDDKSSQLASPSLGKRRVGLSSK